MTILVVHKQKDSIYIASDSRYSLKGAYTDSGPKIFKMSTRIYGPTFQGRFPSDAPILYKGSIGLAFAGDTSFFLSLKGRLEWVLEYIQIAQTDMPYSEIIKDVIFTIYKNLINEACVMHDADVILLLNNSNSNTPQAYYMKASSNKNLTKADITITEINDEYTFGGSGKDTAERLYTIFQAGNSMPHNVFLFTKKVISTYTSSAIAHNENSDVGGDLQAGRLDKNGFEVLGIQDFRESDNFGEFFKYCFGGMTMHDDLSLPHGINVKRSFLKIYNENDIKEKIEEIIKNRYTTQNK